MTDEATPRHEYDVVVIGGGPAGLTTALYTTRLGHRTALIDRGGGRAAMMADTHNVIGIPEDVSGKELLDSARAQLEGYGCDIHRDFVGSAERGDDDRFELAGNAAEYVADVVVLATGLDDVRPKPPLPRTGKGLHYCLHCDAHMFVDRSVYVMGHTESAAHVAAILLNFTDEVDLLTRGEDPEWSDETEELLRNHPIEVIETNVAGVRRSEDGWLEALEFEDGTVRQYRGGFAMYGAEYHNELATSLGCEINDDGSVEADEHGRTAVDGVYAVGDLTPGHNQIPIAMGDGARAGISIHWRLRRFPRDLDDLETYGPVRTEEVPGIPDELLEQAIEFHTYGSDAA